MPSALCYELVGPEAWSEYYCLVNPSRCSETEDDASAMARADLNEAAAAKTRNGSDAEFALVLKNKGYIRLDHFKRARDSA